MIVPAVIQSTTDVKIVKTANPSPATSGGLLIYTFTVTNYSLVTATHVTVSDALPAGETYYTSGGEASYTNVGGNLTLNLGSIAVGATDTVCVAVRVTAPAGSTLTNTAIVRRRPARIQPGRRHLDRSDTRDRAVAAVEVLVSRVGGRKADGGNLHENLLPASRSPFTRPRPFR